MCNSHGLVVAVVLIQFIGQAGENLIRFPVLGNKQLTGGSVIRVEPAAEIYQAVYAVISKSSGLEHRNRAFGYEIKFRWIVVITFDTGF